MNEKELLTKKFLMVKMDEVKISNDEKPIIGTQALATCVAILIYSETNKKAIVAHVSDNIQNMVHQTIELIDMYKLDDSVLKYKIIPGYCHNNYNIKTKLEKIYESLPTMFKPFDESDIPEDFIQIDKDTNSCEFAFDSSTGKFVTNKVLFGKDYFEINKSR